MSSHRESGDEAHVHDEAEDTVVAQAGEGELADAELERAAGGQTSAVPQGRRPNIDASPARLQDDVIDTILP